MALPDHYATLGVLPNASDVSIKKAYRRLVLRYHPDRNPGNRTAEDQFKKVAQAYEVLSRPERRSEYDQLMSAARRSAADRMADSARRQQARRPATNPRPNYQRRTRRPNRRATAYRSNEFDRRDLLHGLTAGAIAALWMGGWLAHEATRLSRVASLLWCALPLVSGWLGTRFGEWAENRWEGMAANLKVGASLAYSLHPLVTPVAALAFICGSIPLAHFLMHAPISSDGVFGGSLAAGFGAAVGAGFGRAFTSVAVRPATKGIGVTVGAMLGTGIGGICGIFLAVNQISHWLEHGNYDSVLTTVFAGAFGAALAGAYGSTTND